MRLGAPNLFGVEDINLLQAYYNRYTVARTHLEPKYTDAQMVSIYRQRGRSSVLNLGI